MELVYELRIGNLVSKSLKSGTGRTLIEKVGPQDIVRIYENLSHFNYHPIPITEEWLLKFGFDRMEKFPLRYVNRMKDDSLTDYEPVIVVGDMWLKKLKYIHQLQNLYFALTQTELEIKN